MNPLVQEIRYAARILRKNPGFTAVAVLTLALGIGTTTAMFSIVHTILLKPLPYPESERIVQIYQTYSEFPDVEASVSVPNFLDWEQRNKVFSHMAAYAGFPFILTGADEPAHVLATMVTPDYFRLLGVTPHLGRTFLPEEFALGEHRVAVLSYEFWQARMGGAEDIVGRPLRLNNLLYTVVGVTPPMAFPRIGSTPFMVPLVPGENGELLKRGSTHVSVLARLKPAVTLAQAEANLDAIARRLRLEYPDTNASDGVSIRSLLETTVTQLRPTLLVLLGAVTFVLLIACANVATLLLLRASSRTTEFAIRTSLGASRGRLIRQALTESGLLAFLGGLLGLLLAAAGIQAFLTLSPPRLPRLDEIAIDASLLVTVLSVTLLSGLVFAIVPAFSLTAGNLAGSLKGGATSTGREGRNWLRNILVLAQVSLTIALLLGAGLMMKSFIKLQQVDPGIGLDNLLTWRVSGNRNMEAPERREFLTRSLERLAEIPGVESAAAATNLPLENIYTMTMVAVGDVRPTEASNQQAGDVIWVSPGYFDALAIPVLRGRTFLESDDVTAPSVAIIDEGLAKRFWGDNDPLGQFISLGMSTESGPRRIVGLVGNVHYDSLERERREKVYIPYLQTPQGYWRFLVRTRAEPAALAKVIKSSLWDLDSDIPIDRFRTGRELFEQWLVLPRLYLILFGLFAFLAGVLAMVGIYGVLSYVVGRRTHEFGVRMALGAQRGNILRMVLRQGMTLVVVGAASGLVVSYWLTRYLKSFLYEVEPTDPLTFVAVTVLLSAVALAACWIPARRATRVDPMTALRYE